MTEQAKAMRDTFMQAAMTEPNQDTQDTQERNFWYDIYKSRIRHLTEPPTPPRFLLEIDDTPFMPAGGITVVTGGKKQGKTHFLAALVACMLSGKDFGRLHRKEEAGGAIMWVDTEQGDYFAEKTYEQVYALAGIPEGSDSTENGLIPVDAVDGLNAEERRKMIQAAVEYDRPAVLIIDGIKDLINDFNDIEQTGELMEWLKGAFSVSRNLRIMLVLHTNPGSDKMRGHLGTELDNKLSDKFTCTKENGVFSVEHMSRGREIGEPFVYRIDALGRLVTSAPEEFYGAFDPDTAFVEAVPEAGASFDDAVKKYAKLTGLTLAKAREALKAKLKTKELIKDKDTKLFYRAGTKQNNLF